MQIKKSLRALRGAKELTLKEASKKLNISISTLLRWEKGETFPNVKEIEKIAEVYDCDQSSIFFKT